MEHIIDNLLKFENDTELFQFKFDGLNIMMWPYARFTYFNEIIFQELNVHKLDSDITRFDVVNTRKNLKYLITLSKELFIPLKEKSILFLTSNVYNTKRVEGKYFNWLYDPYACLFRDQTFILERSHNFELKRPRYFKTVKSYDSILIKTRLRSKFTKTNPIDMKSIDELIDLVCEKSPYKVSENTKTAIRCRLVRMSNELKYQIKYWKKVLDKINPKVIFIDDGSYGGASHIYEEAHSRNIICCEFQHGGVNKQAYHFSGKIINDPVYQKYLPDYYLTFGKFWNGFLVSSTKAIVVGNPKICTVEKKEKPANRKRTILFISTLDFVDNLMDIIRELVENGIDKEFNLIIRPHPNDFNIIDKYLSFGKEYNIDAQLDCTINEALADADAIVSEVSTVIYEALAYNLEIFILNTKLAQYYLPDDIGKRFKDASELIRLLADTDWDKNKSDEIIDNNDIFDSNWKENYTNFINNTCGLLNQEQLLNR